MRINSYTNKKRGQLKILIVIPANKNHNKVRGCGGPQKPTFTLSFASNWQVDFMLVIFFILLLMWALGMISSYTFGGAIHLLLVFALIVLVIRLAQGRSVA
jgi:hypothetical protein